MRVTIKQLERLVDIINDDTLNAKEAWTRDNDGTKANVGTYLLDHAYGGVRLSQICNDAGGQRDITDRVSNGELFRLLHAFLSGHRAARGGM